MADFTGNGRCSCGKEMTGGGGSLSGTLNTSWRKCECGITALFYTLQEGWELIAKAQSKDHQQEEIDTKDKLLSTFKIAGINVLQSWDIKNEYSGDKADWLLVKTSMGLIKIGWRKRVINIDWEDTGIELTVPDDVTKNSGGCHAWAYSAAAEYLQLLSETKRV